MTKPRYIFLSHNSTDKPELMRFAEALVKRPLAQAHNLQVWLDKTNLEHGVQYVNQFAANINHPDTCAFLLFMPREPIRAYVAYEIGIALDRHLNDQNLGKRFPILPVYPGAHSGRVELPQAICTFNYREYVYDDVQQMDAIIMDALGNISPVGASPAGDSSDFIETGKESPAGQAPTREQREGYDVWLSWVLTRRGNELQAEDDGRNISTLFCAGLPGIDATPEQLLPLAIWLLGEQAIDGIKGRVRILTDDPELALLPWHRLPHPQTGVPLLEIGWIVEIGAVRSYSPKFFSLTLNTPLLVIPSHQRHEIAGDRHYALVQRFFEAYLNIHVIPRVTSPFALKRELQLHKPDLIYVFSRFNGVFLELDYGIDRENSISLEYFGLLIEGLEKPPVVVMFLIGDCLSHYPSLLIKSSRIVWIQTTSRPNKKSGDFDGDFEKVLNKISSKNGDFIDSILKETNKDNLGVHNFVWVTGRSPWVQVVDHKNKYALILKAALLKVILGRESLKHHVASVVSTHLSQRISLSAYLVTGDVNACPHDVPAQVQYRLQWGDRENSIPTIQFYFNLDIDGSGKYVNSLDQYVYNMLDDAIVQGILFRFPNAEEVIKHELKKRGLNEQKCCVFLNWFLLINKSQESSVSEWIKVLGRVINEYFSHVSLDEVVLLNAICIQVQDEKSVQDVQSLGNNALRHLRNLKGSSIEPIIIKEGLGRLDAGDISDFLDANQGYWRGELRLKDFNVDSWGFAQWVVSKTNGVFDGTVNLIWQQYQCNYMEYFLNE
ncbi:MAG: toll/interleukin-1 receptor domain-containing protein [Candidatus Thiothrix putei]|uniref:Toll/interleukin-1 receptor domain-containing protein n=1 Tax=Candidatus Thiothrix putei TaxID=3080811 RepID=A0AA95HJN6_9GAMM|nr:MAG: toll/interleukin-1 receptor domain-containing protein [Candidatus Thiothrix putei]